MNARRRSRSGEKHRSASPRQLQQVAQPARSPKGSRKGSRKGSPTRFPSNEPPPEERKERKELNYAQLARICVLGDVLGKGSFGKVKACERVDGQGKYAVKVMDYDTIVRLSHTPEITDYLDFDHPNIVRALYKGFDTDIDERRRFQQIAFLVMEYCPDSIGKKIKNGKVYTSAETARIIRSLCLALKYIHDKGYMHRDVKPDNLLIAPDGTIKLADFTFLTNQLHSSIICGTPEYTAPEVLRWYYVHTKVRPFRTPIEVYTKKVDIWGMGMTCYECLTGRNFYHDRTHSEFEKEAVADGEIPDFPGVEDPHAYAFLRFVLRKDQRARPKIDDVLAHPFLRFAE